MSKENNFRYKLNKLREMNHSKEFINIEIESIIRPLDFICASVANDLIYLHEIDWFETNLRTSEYNYNQLEKHLCSMAKNILKEIFEEMNSKLILYKLTN